MKHSVYISATLRGFTNRNSQVQLEGETVRDLLANLKEEYPETGPALFEETGGLRPFVNLFRNQENVTDQAQWNAVLQEEDALLLLPAIAGGAPTESIISDERRKAVSLDDGEIDRYGKHLMLREIGVKGQKRIKAAKVVIIA